LDLLGKSILVQLEGPMRDTTMKLKTLNKVLNIYLKDNLLNHCRMFKGAIVLENKSLNLDLVFFPQHPGFVLLNLLFSVKRFVDQYLLFCPFFTTLLSVLIITLYLQTFLKR
jgi:hypothetical protein